MENDAGLIHLQYFLCHHSPLGNVFSSCVLLLQTQPKELKEPNTCIFRPKWSPFFLLVFSSFFKSSNQSHDNTWHFLTQNIQLMPSLTLSKVVYGDDFPFSFLLLG